MRSYVLLALAPLMWSGNWLLGHDLHTTLTPIGLNFLRWSVAMAILGAIVAPGLHTRWKLYVKNWRMLCFLGFLGIVVFQIMIYTGLRFTSVINAVVLNSTMPVFMVLISWLMFRELITLRQVIGGVISFAGVLVIVSRGELGRLLSIELGAGDLIILLAMPVWAVYSSLLKRTDTGLDGMETLAGMTAFAVVIMAPLMAVDVWIFGHNVPLRGGIALAVFYIGMFAGVGAFYCWNEGVRGVGPAVAGLMFQLLPAFASLGAVALLGDSLFAYQMAGIVLILAGVYMSTLYAQTGRG